MLSSQQLQNTQGFVRLKSFVNNQSNNTELVDQTNTLLIAITLKNQTLGLQPDDLTNIANLVETLQSRIEILKINNIQLNEDLMYAHYKNIFIKKITTINHQLNKNPTVRPPDLDSIVKLTSTLRNAISPDNIFYKVIMTLMSETKVAISTQTTTMEVNDLSINYESLTALRKTLLTFFNGGSARPFYSLLPNNIKEISTIINNFVYLINMSVTLVQHEFPDTIETQNIFTQLNQLMPQFNDTLSTIINQMDQDDESQQTTNSLQPIQTQTDMLCKKMQQLIITVKNQLPGEQQQAISSITERAIQTATTIQNITTDQKPPPIPPLNLTVLPPAQLPIIDSPSEPTDTDRTSSTDTARTHSTRYASSNSSRLTSHSQEKLDKDFIITLIQENFKNTQTRSQDKILIEHANEVAAQIAANILNKITEFEKQKQSFKFQEPQYRQTPRQKTQEENRQKARHENKLGEDIFNFIKRQMVEVFPKYDTQRRSCLTWLTKDQCLGQKKPTARLLENVLRKKLGLEEKKIPAETPRSYSSIDSTPRNNPKDEPKATEEPLYVFPQELESAIIEFLQLIPISLENKQLLLDQTKRDLSSQQDSDQWLHFFKQKTLEIQLNTAEPLTKISSNEQIANQIHSANQNQLASIDSPELRAKQEAINKLISEYLSLQISLPQPINTLDTAFYDYIRKKQTLLAQLISDIESLSKDISQTTTTTPPATIEVLATPRTEALTTPRVKNLSPEMQAYYVALISLLKIIHPTPTEQFIAIDNQIKEELLTLNLEKNETPALLEQCTNMQKTLKIQQNLSQRIAAKTSILEEESKLIDDETEDIISDVTIEKRIEILQTEIKTLQASEILTRAPTIKIQDTEPFIKQWQNTIQTKLSTINDASTTTPALSQITQELTKAITDLQKFIYIPPTDNSTYILKGQETLIAQEQQLNQQRTQTLKLSPLQLPSTEALLTEVDSIQIQQTNISLPDICSQVISTANQLILNNKQSQQQELEKLKQLEDYIKTNTEKISLEKSLLSTKADILTAIKIIEITEQAKLTIERLEKITQANQLASQFIELYNAIEQPLESSTIQTLKEKIQNLSNDIPHSIIQLLLKI